MRCRKSQGADALGDLVHRQGEFRVLRFEHEMQRIEHRAGDVPVKVVGLEIERVTVGEQPRQTSYNFV